MKLADDRDVKEEAISYETALNAVRDARMLRLIVLDACRSYPIRLMHDASRHLEARRF